MEAVRWACVAGVRRGGDPVDRRGGRLGGGGGRAEGTEDRSADGLYGTGPATAAASAASAAWEAAYVAEYGSLPVLAYVKEAYDATVALVLAAEAAGSTDGAAIRDRLRAIGGPPGIAVTAGPRGVAAALRALADGAEIDYQGASGSIDWDDNGDLRRGHVGIWRFTTDERIEETGTVAFTR